MSEYGFILYSFELLVNSFLLRRVIFLDLVTVAWYSHNERRFKMDFIEKAKFFDEKDMVLTNEAYLKK